MHVCWTVVEFVEVETMLLAVYYFRHQEDAFDITTELKVIAAATFAQCVLDYYKINTGIYLVQCLRDIIVIVASNLMPVLQSYRKESNIRPTPEILENFTLTLKHAKAWLFFRHFLMRVPAVIVADSTFSITTATADQYLFFLADTTDFETRRSLSKARQVRKKYIVSGLFTQELRHRAEEGLDSAGTAEQAREALEPLILFAKEKLEYELFPMYKESEVFGDMQRETEQFWRLK